jgi:hypothetical protein
MIETDADFRLSAYLKHLSCHLTLASGRIVDFRDVSFSDAVICDYEKNTMVHDFWANAIADLLEIKNGIGTLRIDYRISFTGHDGEYEYFETIVPLIKRETIFDQRYQRPRLER